MINQYTQRFTRRAETLIEEYKNKPIRPSSVSGLPGIRETFRSNSERNELIEKSCIDLINEAEMNLYPNMPELKKVLGKMVEEYLRK